MSPKGKQNKSGKQGIGLAANLSTSPQRDSGAMTRQSQAGSTVCFNSY